MVEGLDHQRCVQDWLARVGTDAPAEVVVQAFERAFQAVLRRASVTLGEVTLAAIVDRVLTTAAERFIELAGLRLDGGALRCDELKRRARGIERARLEGALAFVLLELLTVLGSLTAEILSPALHDELARVPTLALAADSKGTKGQTS